MLWIYIIYSLILLLLGIHFVFSFHISQWLIFPWNRFPAEAILSWKVCVFSILISVAGFIYKAIINNISTCKVWAYLLSYDLQRVLSLLIIWFKLISTKNMSFFKTSSEDYQWGQASVNMFIGSLDLLFHKLLFIHDALCSSIFSRHFLINL